MSLPLITSPRISFSHDLDDEDDSEVAVEMEEDQEDSSPMDASSNCDDDHSQKFDFSFSDSFTFEPSSSSADELFSDGLIRPLQLEEKFVTSSKHTSIHPPLSQHNSATDDQCSKPSLSKETIVTTTSSPTSDVAEPSEQKNQSSNKSFWNIKRSSSVHIDNSHKRSSFWSLPLMSRSNSTGSAPSPRHVSKEIKKQNLQKQHKGSSASASSSSSFYMYQLSQKPPLKKNHGGSYGNGAWNNPAHNVPPPYIAKGTANLFGITSLFKDKKDKKIKK